MKALVYLGDGKFDLRQHRKPEIMQPTDAIVKMHKTSLCGTDLHILNGDVPSCATGRVLGHEGVGVVEQVGAAVSAFKVGDKVVISCISACGKCAFCRKLMYSHCVTGGWLLGNTVDGTQAEFVRIPYADTSLHPIAAHADDEAMLMLSDILPTAMECGARNGKVQPGSSVAIVGAGPVGLAALLAVQLLSPIEIVVMDLDDNRLKLAKQLGATAVVNSGRRKADEIVMKLTSGHGVDTAIEAVGISATFELCQKIIAPGGTIANIGVHGTKADLHLESLWGCNINITMGLVDTVSTPQLLRLVTARKIDPKVLITHHFTLDDAVKAYETFQNASTTKALKVVITA